MAQLEMCFPPSSFDIMEHLMIHMVDQICALGPLYLHEMWTYEYFLSHCRKSQVCRVPAALPSAQYRTFGKYNICQVHMKSTRQTSDTRCPMVLPSAGRTTLGEQRCLSRASSGKYSTSLPSASTRALGKACHVHCTRAKHARYRGGPLFFAECRHRALGI